MSGSRLSAVETAYVELAAQGTPVQIGSVGTFEGGPLLDEEGLFRIDDVRARVAARLHLLPRLRQRIVPAPLGLGRPSWIDAVDFDVADHVQVVSLCQPRDEAALHRLAAELMVQPLDPLRPPWHLCFVTGLSHGRVALVERASHALIDGVSGVDLALVLLDLDADVAPIEPPPWQPEQAPGALRSLVSAWRDQVAVPARLAGATMAAVRRPASIPARLGEVVAGVEASLGGGGRAPRSSLNQPTGAGRSLHCIRQELAPISAAGRAVGATVNEVVLAAVTGGLRTLLLARGEDVASDLELRALVPVSLRGVDERGALGNRVSALLMPLPVGLGDARERLRVLTETSRRLKAGPEAAASASLLDLADALPAPVIGGVMRLLTHQPLVNLVVTNVPGPDVPLYAMGARLLDAVPMVPLAGNLTLGVAVLSYCGELTLGITADTGACPDVATFVAGVERAFAEVLVPGARVLS